MLSEQWSLKTPSMTTPPSTRTGSFAADPSTRDSAVTLGLDAKKKGSVEVTPRQCGAESLSNMGCSSSTLEVSDGHSDPFLDEPDHESEEDANKAAELELLRALEAARAEINMRQLPAETVAAARKPSASDAAASSLPVFGASSIKVASSSIWSGFWVGFCEWRGGR